ncbi:hypothetical protein [Chryseobacterium koreense]|uniref:Uncharacterized protein n=1 Tax=Chryseobacterium koreense CCUG 49689 TaxID=1304281 RepID=A0A0J7IW10_9FLAO|nr:hypothetical protein [Chryseobacterium koreense]KMQ70152.1 hypothetical protein ACM44_13850 [Chryseobacterium koreense CCUG 49689]MBB5333942.1 hypothetical protein [Chryseobacterium koreense]
MDQFALSYEYLIRRVYQCGRYGVAGANADEYRRLERTHNYLKNNKSKVKSEDIFKYGFECGQITAYIRGAIEKFRNDFFQNLSNEEKIKIDEILVTLIDGKLDVIQKSITDAEKIMLDHNLKP